ncbi:MAG TPA: hypothetical protein DCR12_00060, partial [Lachnospiraceae bacterium]|nr:hypothetical protein [Lachnospiraceae bacterium]
MKGWGFHMKKKNDTPEVAVLKDKMKIALCGIIVVLLVLMEVYSMIHFGIVVDIIVGILIAIDVFFLITFALDLSQKNKEAERKEYQDLYKAQKASYLVIRKSFDELQNRIDMLEEKTAIPADEIITAQKAVAKVTISRSKENTDALMNSNDELINHLFSFEEKLDANNQGLIEKQEQLLDATREEILEKNKELEAKVEALNTIIDGMQSSVTGMQDTVTGVQNSVIDIKKDIEVLESKEPVVQMVAAPTPAPEPAPVQEPVTEAVVEEPVAT